MKGFFNIGSSFGILRLSGLRHKGGLQKWLSRVVYQETKDLDFAARRQISGYGELTVGIDEKIVKMVSSCLAFPN